MNKRIKQASDIYFEVGFLYSSCNEKILKLLLDIIVLYMTWTAPCICNMFGFCSSIIFIPSSYREHSRIFQVIKDQR